MIPDSPAPGIVIRAPDNASARESGDEARVILIKGTDSSRRRICRKLQPTGMVIHLMYNKLVLRYLTVIACVL